MVRRRGERHSGDMTTTPPDASPTDVTPPPADRTDGPRVTGTDLKDVTRLRRTTGADRHLAGVSGGLARFFDIDPRLVRVLMVVLAVFGVGVLLYLALWLLLPDDAGGRALIDLDPRSLAVALILVTGLLLLPVVAGSPWQAVWVLGPMLLLAALVAALVQSRSSRPGPAATPYGAAPSLQTGQTPAGPTGTLPAAGLTTGPTAGPTGPAMDPTGALPPGAVPPWTPAPVPPRPPRPPDPRKKGPILFWVALALVSLGLGILGVVDLSGQDVPPSAYPALGLAICAVILLIGSFFGRAGGVILLGLALALGTTAVTVAEQASERVRLVEPASSSGVRDHYWVPAGTYTLDLSQVSDLSRLDGRHLSMQGLWADLTVIVPAQADVRVTAEIGPGRVEVFGDAARGPSSMTRRQRVPDPQAAIWLDVGLGAGQITILSEGETS